MTRRTAPARLLGLTAAVVLALGAAGCGERDTSVTKADPTPSPSATSAAPDTTPQCAAVWKAGATFPEDYAGCLEGGKKVADKPVICETGQELYTYHDRFYAVANAPVQHTAGPLKDNPKFQTAYAHCTG